MSSKSVRFAAEDDTNGGGKKRRRKITVVGGSLDNEDDENDEDGKASHQNRKRSRIHDEPEGDEGMKDGNDDDTEATTSTGEAGILSEKELLQAKWKRRQLRDMEFQKGGTHIDDNTTLAVEGVKVEPFHMKAEEEDGTGYFDGETYVFRSNGGNVDDEPDAWLDDLQEKQGSQAVPATTGGATSNSSDEEEGDSEEKDVDKDTLYRTIVGLMIGKETVAQALRRYGQLVKKTTIHKGHNKRGSTAATTTAEAPDEAQQLLAKRNLDDLTSAANALLLQGEVDIYQTPRMALLSKASSSLKTPPAVSAAASAPATTYPPAEWEYMGNEDGQIHGPYTTEQMIGWTKAGYFVGEQTVKIRTIRQEALSTGDDLMADLMDDDDDEAATPASAGKQVKGDWMMSTGVNFQAYITR